MKIAIASKGEGLQAAMEPRIGRAKSFVIVDTESNSVSTVASTVTLSATEGVAVQASRQVAGLGVGALLSGHVGPAAFLNLTNGNVSVYPCVAGTVVEAVEQFKAGKLKVMQSGSVESFVFNALDKATLHASGSASGDSEKHLKK